MAALASSSCLSLVGWSGSSLAGVELENSYGRVQLQRWRGLQGRQRGEGGMDLIRAAVAEEEEEEEEEEESFVQSIGTQFLKLDGSKNEGRNGRTQLLGIGTRKKKVTEEDEVDPQKCGTQLFNLGMPRKNEVGSQVLPTNGSALAIREGSTAMEALSFGRGRRVERKCVFVAGAAGAMEALSFGRGRRVEPKSVFVAGAAGATGRIGPRISQLLHRVEFSVRGGVPDLDVTQQLAEFATQDGVKGKDEARRLNAVGFDVKNVSSVEKAPGNAGKVVVTVRPTEDGTLGNITRDDGLRVLDAATLSNAAHLVFDGEPGTGVSADDGPSAGFAAQLGNFFKVVKDGLVQAGEPLLQWAEIVGKRTGVDKIIVRDVEFIREGIHSVQEDVQEILRMRRWEDALIAGEIRPPWPEPAYSGLSGKDLLTADIETLKSYGNYFRGFFNTWRIPLQLSYDPEAVASYFNRRPHLLLFRFLEVSAALSGVALQSLLDNARVQRNQSSWIGGSEGDQSTLKNAEALKQTLLRLGPTFIKVAQSLSSRPDLIGTETAKVLSELQDRLPPFPTEEAMAVIELELGIPVNEVFSFLSANPVAAASFGQVYRGRTMEGEEVAVKVQRPDLLFDVALDICVLRIGLAILRKLARMNSDISLLADEIGYGLLGELDYTLEAANAMEFGASVRHLSYVKVPATLPHLTRKRVLTMEWITGYRPLDLQLIVEGYDLHEYGLAGIDRQEAKLYLDDLVKKGVECSLVQLLETGVMHADPHPGNLLYTKEGTLVYLDFGLLAHVNRKHRAAMLAVIAHLVNAEWQCLANDFGDLDILKPSTDRFALRLALERAFGEGPDAVVKDGVPDIQFGQVTGKLWEIALKFRFRLPPYYTLVLRALASLEGVAVSVDPDYKVFAAAYPYVIRRLLSDNSRPSRQVFQSLVLTQERKFRWDRIADIMATSREGSHDSVMQRTASPPGAGLPGLQSKRFRDGNALASVLLSFTLSKEGTSVRRVLLEADVKSLAKAFISPSSASLRRKVGVALAESFYPSIGTFRSTRPKCANMSTGAGYDSGKTMDSVSSTTEMSRHDLSHPETQSVVSPRNVDSSQLSLEPSLSNHRLWFLLKVLASRLTSSPILMLRVSWTFVTMVAFAAALALQKFVVTLSDRILSIKTDRILGVIPRPADPLTNQVQGDSFHNTA